MRSPDHVSSRYVIYGDVSLGTRIDRIYYKWKRLTSAWKRCFDWVGRMIPRGSQKANSLAIAGFLAPFAMAGITGILILGFEEDITSSWVSIIYLTIVPLGLLTGIILCLKSIPLIEELGDKDYAYSGLTLNILFLVVYIISVVYFISSPI